MKFSPKTEEDIKREGLLPEGVYDFEVTKSEDKVSASGNEMIAVHLKVFGPNGERNVRDWLMEKMAYKLRHFCSTTGLLPKYEAGTLCAEDCVGRSGKVKIAIKNDEQYGPQNAVKDYSPAASATEPAMVKAAPAPAPRLPAGNAAPGVDEIPF